MIGSRGQQRLGGNPRFPPKPWGSSPLPRFGSRGQQWTAMQMLQGGVLAMVMLVIVWGVVQSAKDQTPKADVYSVTCEILGSAFAARDTGQHFTREALLVEQEIFANSLLQCSGLPMGTPVKLFCQQAYCLKDGESLDRTNDCRQHSPCSEMALAAGETADVCTVCKDGECQVWFGETAC